MPHGPQAEFDVSYTSGVAPLTLRFYDQSLPGDSAILSWSWDFGDGSNRSESNDQHPIHMYTDAGTYDVSLTVTTADGEDTITKSTLVTVTEREGKLTIMLPGNVPLVMEWCPPGTFMMGRRPDERDSDHGEDYRHEVTLSYGFWMGRYPVTKGQWTAVMGTTPWSDDPYSITDADSPAVDVAWNDVKAFIAALNDYTGEEFRLPSEAEWEYAARAGTTTQFYWGDDPDYTQIAEYAWYWENCSSEQYAHVVGLMLPNSFGLYDMSGNVWEWCEDDWHFLYTNPPLDGSAWVDSPRGTYRIVRGGSWASIAGSCRSANRFYTNPSYSYDNLGFRLCL